MSFVPPSPVETEYIEEFQYEYFNALDSKYAQMYQDEDTDQTFAQRQNEKLDRLIRFNPSNSLAFAHRAANYLILGERDQAIADYAQAIKLDQSAGYYNNQGILYAEKGDFDAASAAFEEILKIEVENPNAYFNLALIAYRRKDNNLALVYLSQAIGKNPDFRDAYRFRAKIYRLEGNTKAAEADEQTARKSGN